MRERDLQCFLKNFKAYRNIEAMIGVTSVVVIFTCK